MASYNFGLFAGFNLENERYLQELAIALEHWLAGGRDDKSKEMRKLTQVQERTIGNLAQTMSRSPLLRRLLTRLLQAPRTGESQELVDTGKDLIDYAIPGIERPGSSAYNDAVIAWQNRWPMRPRVNDIRNYAAPMETTLGEFGHGKRRVEGTCEDTEVRSDTYEERRAEKKRKTMPSAGAATAGSYDYVSTTTSKQPLRSFRKLASSQRGDMNERGAKGTKNKDQLPQASTEDSQDYIAPRNTNYYPLLQPRAQRSTSSSTRSQFQTPQSPTPESEESQILKEFRRKRRIDIIASYDKSISMLPSGWVPGRIKFGPDGLDYVDGHDTSMVAEALEPGATKNTIPPRKRPGDFAIDDGTLDLENAVVGERDESKLFIEYRTTRRDPNNPNNTICGDRVQKHYREAVDFNDADSVKRLNAWRGQIFRRNFPEIFRKKFNHAWLQSEMDAILGLVRAQMTTRKKLTWVSLANAYNLTMAGLPQKAGEKLVKSGNRKADVLKEDRQAPRRTGASIQGALNKLQQFRELMEELLPTIAKDENDADREDLVETKGNDEDIPEKGSSLRA